MYGHTNMEFSIDHSSPIPLYHQVETLIRELIALPDYQEGQLLPNEIELSQRLGVSRSTVRQALNNLVNESLIERKKGIGTRVVKRPLVSNLNSWVSFTREMSAKGLEVVNYDIHVEMRLPSEEVSSALDMKSERAVLRLDRVRGTNEKPMVVSTSWFHPRIGIGLEESFESPLYELLDEKYHVVVQFSQEEIKAEKASARLAKLLDIQEGDPILSRYRIVSDAGRRPVEYNKTYYRADSFTYFIELQRR